MEVIQKYFPELSAIQLEQFEKLKQLYEVWNSRINVISRKDMDDFYLRHVLHSLAIVKVIKFQDNSKILDVGTGGGFPAVPLSIYFPKVSFLAIDSIAKKIKVVNAVKDELNLTNLVANQKNAKEVKGKFDFVVSRAVTRTKNFLPWVEDNISRKSFNDLTNGYLFLKGGDLKEELAEIGNDFKELEIGDYYEEDFFETKKVVYLPKARFKPS